MGIAAGLLIDGSLVSSAQGIAVAAAAMSMGSFVALAWPWSRRSKPQRWVAMADLAGLVVLGARNGCGGCSRRVSACGSTSVMLRACSPTTTLPPLSWGPCEAGCCSERGAWWGAPLRQTTWCKTRCSPLGSRAETGATRPPSAGWRACCGDALPSCGARQLAAALASTGSPRASRPQHPPLPTRTAPRSRAPPCRPRCRSLPGSLKAGAPAPRSPGCWASDPTPCGSASQRFASDSTEPSLHAIRCDRSALGPCAKRSCPTPK